MAAINTHNIFAKDVYEKLDKSVQKNLKSSFELYLVFSQSFDFFFYNNRRKWRQFGTYCHKSNTQSYFINMIRNIINSKKQNDSEALAYLYGSINHYVLDTIIHPYIFYKSGIYNRKDKNTLKYSGLHGRSEYMLDAFMYESKYKKRFFKYKFINDLMPVIKPSEDLINLINDTYKKTYNKDNIAKHYFKSYRLGRILYRLFIYDPTGIKKSLYKIYDFFTPRKSHKYQYYSFYIKEFDFTLLNIGHKEWHHPSDKKIKYTTSFIDLYNAALEKSVSIIDEVTKIINEDDSLDKLLEIIPNISYVSGLPITNNKPMKFFEF